MHFNTSTLLVLALSLCVVNGAVNLLKFEHCDPAKDYPIKMTAKLKEDAGKQVIEEATLKSTIPLGNNILDIADVYEFEDGKYEHLITLREPLCDAVHKYVGEFAHHIQSAAGIDPGSCPVPAGEYQISNHALDFEKFKFKKIPAGQYKVEVNLIDSAKNETLNCHFIEFKVEPAA